MKYKNFQEFFRKKKITTTMLDYCKLLLTKISFDQMLFRKEYEKGLQYLNPAEQIELKTWLRKNHKK